MANILKINDKQTINIDVCLKNGKKAFMKMYKNANFDAEKVWSKISPSKKKKED